MHLTLNLRTLEWCENTTNKAFGLWLNIKLNSLQLYEVEACKTLTYIFFQSLNYNFLENLKTRYNTGTILVALNFQLH